MEDWNVNVPQLSLWSRPDWTPNHKAIALKNGHLSTDQEGLTKRDAPDCNPIIDNLDYGTPMVAGDIEVLQQQHEGEEDSHVPRDCSKDQGNNDISKEVNKSSRKRIREPVKKSSEQRRVASRPSPSICGSRSQGKHLTKHPEMYSQADIQREGHQHFDHVYDGSSRLQQQQLQSGHGSSYHDDATRRQNGYSEEPIPNMLERRTPILHHPIQGLMSRGGNFSAYQTREADIRARVQMYGGHQDPVPFSHRDDNAYFRNAPSSVYSASYVQHGSVANPPYDSMNASAMQRYAPRLEELNHTRMQHQQPYPGRSGRYGTAPPQPEYQPNSQSFASGPYHHYSAQNSSGWLND